MAGLNNIFKQVMRNEITMSKGAELAKMELPTFYRTANGFIKGYRHAVEDCIAAVEDDDYDAGYLNDYGGGNVDWWFDYIRAEIGRCNEYWRSRIDAIRAVKENG